jgi:hypothetical protein
MNLYTVSVFIACGGEMSRTRPDRAGAHAFSCTVGSQYFFRGIKLPGRSVDRPHPSSAKVNERIGLYHHYHSGSSCPVLGRTLLYLLSVFIAKSQ